MRRGKAKPAKKSTFKDAFRAGQKIAARQLAASEGNMDARSLNNEWCDYWGARQSRVTAWKKYFVVMNAFNRGVRSKAADSMTNNVFIPTKKSVAVVVTVMNEAHTLHLLLKQLRRLPLAEVIVVINGSSDDSFKVAHTSGATVAHYSEALGHDVGRAIGAKLSKAEIVLFLDGDIPIKAEQLVPYIYAIHRGCDVALNNIIPYLKTIQSWDGVTLLKAFLNQCLYRKDLSANSLTAVPHALSRKAIEKIGIQNLAVPPKAQLLAIQGGLQVKAPFSVNVIATNKQRKQNSGRQNPVSELIMGDHFEALHSLHQLKGSRMGFVDVIRKRAAAGGMRP